jgi:hypothetical protein
MTDNPDKSTPTPDPKVTKLPTARGDDLYDSVFPGDRERARQKLDETLAANQANELTEMQRIEIKNNANRKAHGLPHLSDEDLRRKIFPPLGPKRVEE